MKTITDDPEVFFEDGGWNFLDQGNDDEPDDDDDDDSEVYCLHYYLFTNFQFGLLLPISRNF